MQQEGSAQSLGWPGAVGLMAATGVLAIGNPGVLVAVPLAFLALFRAPWTLPSVLVAVLSVLLVFGGSPLSGLWYLERGWALLLGGWFLALTLRWPEGAFISRGLGAVAGSYAAMGLLFWKRPGQWALVDWAVTSRMEDGMAVALQAVRYSLGPSAVSPDTEARMWELMALQKTIFPSVLGLASLAALGLAWWLLLRLSRSKEVGIRPLAEFRFNDQLVWVLIVGFGLLLASTGLAERMGVNTVVFMGALYALRGVAVITVLLGGPTVMLGVGLVLAFLLAAPFFLIGAFVFGLGDTWFNFRARKVSSTPQGGPGGTS